MAPTADKAGDDNVNILIRSWRWYESTVSGWCAVLARANGRLGVAIVRRPVWTLCLSLLLVGLCAGGWARFDMQSDSNKLWAPRVSKARSDKSWVEGNYAFSDSGVQFLATLQPQWMAPSGPFGGNNVIQLPVTWEMFKVDAAIRALSVTSGGVAYKFSDICLTDAATGACSNAGYLNYWNMSFTTYLASCGGSATDRTAGNYSQLLTDVNKAKYPDGSTAVPVTVFAPLVLGGDPLQLTGAQVIAVGYSVAIAVPKSVSEAWFKAYLSLMKTVGPTLGLQYTHYNFIAATSVGDEIGRSVSHDIMLIIISVIIFFVVAVVGISRRDWVETRSSLAVVGVAGAALAVVSGYGLSMLMGQAFTTLELVLPYIFLGVSVDVMFILVKGFDEIVAKEPHLDLEQRFFKLMAGPGFSCGVVLIASAVAFALGATSVLPATTWFSVYATLGTLAILFIQLTLFIAVFVLNEKRIAARRRDCCCCSVRPAVRAAGASAQAVAEGEQGARLAEHLAPAEVAIEMPGAVPAASATGSNNLFKVWFEKYYAPFLMLWPVRILVLLIFVALCVASGLSIAHLQRGQPISDLAPKDSYLIPYDKLSKDTFGYQSGDAMSLYFRDIDISQPTEQGAMLEALALTLGSPFVNATLSAFQGNWLIDFIGWVGTNNASSITSAGACVNPYVGATSGLLAQYSHPKVLPGCVAAAPFYMLFNQWLQVPGNGGRISSFVKTQVPGSSPAQYTVTASRFLVVEAAAKGDGAFNGDSIKSFRKVEDAVNNGVFAADNQALPGSFKVFVIYGNSFIFSEGDAILSDMAMEYAIVALCGVGFVMIFMLVNPVAVLMMMIAVGMVDLLLFGEMWALGIRFNQVSVINTIMATGLAVDYSVYWAQKFMTTVADGTRVGRVKQALAETGSAVFLGGITALLGSLPLAFSSSTILSTFWKLLWGTIIFALIIGLILVPVVFSIIGPPPLLRLARALDQLDDDEDSRHRGVDGARSGPSLIPLTDVADHVKRSTAAAGDGQSVSSGASGSGSDGQGNAAAAKSAGVA